MTSTSSAGPRAGDRLRAGIAAVAALALAAALAGCQTPGPASSAQGAAPDDVLTLEKTPADKTLVTMSVEDGMDADRLESAIERRFDAVDIVVVPNSPLQLDSEHRNLEDLVLTAFNTSSKMVLADEMIDLSGEDFVQNYYLNSLDDCSVDGRLPYLPGPSNIYGIVYDKELFEQNGWEAPRSRDEFMALCAAIEATGIRALQPALHFSDATRQFFDGFTYQDLFAGVDNHAWLQSYRAGDASLAGHIEPGLAVMQDFLDAGVLRPGDFDVRPKVRTNMLYKEHTCAMALETQMAPAYAKRYGEGQEHEVAMMPFYSGDEDSDYLLSVPNFYIGANAALDEPGNEEKRELVLGILAWMSTVEGQQAIINPETPLVSSVKGMPLGNSPFLENVAETIEKGHVVPQPFLVGTTGTELDATFRESLAAWARGELSTNDLVKACDKARDQVLANESARSLVAVGTARADFTVMETSLYLADLFRTEMGADIGLCLSNTRSCGNNVRLYAGDIMVGDDEALDGFLDICFYTNDLEENADRQLQRVEMTGRQVLDALNDPVEQAGYPNRYYVASGLTIEFAPWAGDGSRYVSVTLPDGSPLDEDAVYTVALWNGSVDPAYVGNVQETSPHKASELLIADVKAAPDGIAPFDDGRFTLNWDVCEPAA